MVSSPTPAHESVLSVITSGLTIALGTIPVPKSILPRLGSNSWFEEDSILGVPDLSIMMWSKGNESTHQPRALCIMECAFTQSDLNVMEKLQAYVRDLPDLLVVGKIVLKQRKRFHNPKPTAAQQLRSSGLRRRGVWAHNYGSEEHFSRVVVDGHVWFSLSSVEIHIWVRQDRDCKIDLNCSSGDGYARGVCRLTITLYVGMFTLLLDNLSSCQSR